MQYAVTDYYDTELDQEVEAVLHRPTRTWYFPHYPQTAHQLRDELERETT